MSYKIRKWHIFKEKTVKENLYIKVGRMYSVEARRNRCTHSSALYLEEDRRTRNREKKDIQ
jgi:hypothetical protein